MPRNPIQGRDLLSHQRKFLLKSFFAKLILLLSLIHQNLWDGHLCPPASFSISLSGAHAFMRNGYWEEFEKGSEALIVEPSQEDRN